MYPTTKISLRRTIVYAFWLPIAVAILSLIRFGRIAGSNEGQLYFMLLDLASLLVAGWLSAIALTVVLQLLYVRSRPVAWVTGIVGVPSIVTAFLIGGLFGYVGSFLYAWVVSLPAWLVFAILILFRRIRKKPDVF